MLIKFEGDTQGFAETLIRAHKVAGILKQEHCGIYTDETNCLKLTLQNPSAWFCFNFPELKAESPLGGEYIVNINSLFDRVRKFKADFELCFYQEEGAKDDNYYCFKFISDKLKTFLTIHKRSQIGKLSEDKVIQPSLKSDVLVENLVDLNAAIKILKHKQNKEDCQIYLKNDSVSHQIIFCSKVAITFLTAEKSQIDNIGYSKFIQINQELLKILHEFAYSQLFFNPDSEQDIIKIVSNPLRPTSFKFNLAQPKKINQIESKVATLNYFAHQFFFVLSHSEIQDLRTFLGILTQERLKNVFVKIVFYKKAINFQFESINEEKITNFDLCLGDKAKGAEKIAGQVNYLELLNVLAYHSDQKLLIGIFQEPRNKQHKYLIIQNLENVPLKTVIAMGY